MTSLPSVTVVAVTTKDYGPTIVAIQKTLEQIKPARTIYFSDVPHIDPAFEWIKIEPFKSVEDYNHFIFKKLGDYIETSHVLVVQHDGFVLNGDVWDNAWIQYDYIGAPWTYTDGRNVGNGGFSLRSRFLQKVLQRNEFEYYSPEDEKICRYYRQTLEKKHNIKFAPDHIAHKFSFELHKPVQKTFGFHNYHQPAWREPIILKRTGAMGDVIMMEPVMDHFYKLGYRVVLDTQGHYYDLFAQHFYHVEYLGFINEDTTNWRTVNLDMAYEVLPKELVLKSYYKTCGIENGEIRNSRLNFRLNENKKEAKMFDKYVVIHTDDTEMPHRNVHDVDWEEVAEFIEQQGYVVLRVGVGNGRGGIKINTFSQNMLGYIVGNADYFIGLDSGIAQIAVATGVKSMIFFGSVNPVLRYPDMSNISVMQRHCPANAAGCYHSVVSVKGTDCVVDVNTPPCIKWDTEEVISSVVKFLK
jgi:ADP-heptose:LPS heptosyltransferase